MIFQTSHALEFPYGSQRCMNRDITGEVHTVPCMMASPVFSRETALIGEPAGWSPPPSLAASDCPAVGGISPLPRALQGGSVFSRLDSDIESSAGPRIEKKTRANFWLHLAWVKKRRPLLQDCTPTVVSVLLQKNYGYVNRQTDSLEQKEHESDGSRRDQAIDWL